jgi:hypothetical protein
MRYEIFRSSSGEILVKVLFEEESNFNSDSLTWVPEINEIKDIYEAIMMTVSYNNLKRDGKIIDSYDDVEFS